MPVFNGFAKREEDDKNLGAAKALIGFPNARRLMMDREPTTGQIVSHYVPNPHQRALNHIELRAMRDACAPDSETHQFYDHVMHALIAFIESNGAVPASGDTDSSRPALYDEALAAE